MLSSEQLHNNPNVFEFVGPYKHIRSKLDYNYFLNYTLERQHFQNELISTYFQAKNTSFIPEIIFTCGCFGAGKSRTIDHLIEQNILYPKDYYVYIDPDKIKHQLPEMQTYINMCPLEAGNLTHKESTFIALIIEYYALEQNYNIIVDGSLQNALWYQEYFCQIKQNYPLYTIGIIKVDASLENIKQRCIDRAKKTGRVIDEKLIEKIYNQIPISFQLLKDKVDWYQEIINNVRLIIGNKIINE